MSAWGECSGVSVAVGRRRCEEAGEIHGLDCERSQVLAVVSYGCDVGTSQGLNLVLICMGQAQDCSVRVPCEPLMESDASE